MYIDKDKLPKGVSYVLRTSRLVEALAAADISVEVYLRYSLNRKLMLGAHFWPPNPQVGHERFYLTVGVVSSSEARDARLLVESTVLPQFIVWANQILALSADSPIRQVKQYFEPNLDAYVQREGGDGAPTFGLGS